MSPLLYACQHSHCGLAQLLVDTNADVNKQDTRGWTVSLSVKNGWDTLLRVLEVLMGH